jgi:hypothetical protein
MNCVIVKIKKARSGTGNVVTSVTIPKPIAEALERVGVKAFDFELTEEGVVLRPVSLDDANERLPAWLRPAEAPSDGPSTTEKQRESSRRATRTAAARTASA